MSEQRKTVLIVDDYPNWREVFQSLLEDDFETTCVSSYEDALAALQQKTPPFDVAIVDIRLLDADEENQDGLKLAEEIRKISQDTQVVVVTGYPNTEVVREAYHKAAVNFIEKAEKFDKDFFREVVRKAAMGEAQPMAIPLREKDQSGTDQQSVLIVDDAPNWVQIFYALLKENFDVKCAKNFEEAENLLRENRGFHVAIVDIRLNDLDRTNEDGLKLIKEINDRSEYTSVIIVTGNPKIETVKKSLFELHVYDYLVKSEIDINSFPQIVRNAADLAEKRGTGKQSVLIIDDAPNWVQVFYALLKENFDVKCAKNFEEAENLLRENRGFHVAIVDIRLNDLDHANEDGLKLIKEINGRGEYTSVIVVTGNPKIETVKKSLFGLNAYDYLVKSEIDTNSFPQIVRNAADLAEGHRPDSYTPASKRILLVEETSGQFGDLVKILKEDGYDAETKRTTEIQNLSGETKYDLVILNQNLLQNGEIISAIRKNSPNVRTIAALDSGNVEMLRVIQNQKVHGVINTEPKDFNEQAFKDIIRRSFAPEFTKYVVASFKELEEQEILKLKNKISYTLILTMQNKPGKGTTESIWLPPSDNRHSEKKLQLSIFTSEGIKVQPERVYWPIPSIGVPMPIEIQITPYEIGEKTIVIDIEYGQNWLGRLEKKLNVVETR